MRNTRIREIPFARQPPQEGKKKKKEVKMATIEGRGKGSQRTAMERFGRGGMSLLPWTKQMLTGLWEQLRVLINIICYTFMSVFQMFRFEVHVRITDETGQQIQHSGMMVGGSTPLSNFCADVGDPIAGKSTAEALLSSLRADDLCCGLVDDFVSRTTGDEDGIFRGRHSSWNMGFPSDWNIFVSSGDGSSASDSRRKRSERLLKRDISKENTFKQDSSEEERNSHWSSEEDLNIAEFDSEESKALWESLSQSSDPYNPFFFSACISTNTSVGKGRGDARDSGGADVVSVRKVGEETGPRGLSHSDSESSWSSWAGSDASANDIDEEAQRLLEFFSNSDPYNPMCFTACTVSSTTVPKQQTSPPPPLSDAEERGSSVHPSSEDDEVEQLWRSLCSKDDPYHPLNFQACIQSSPVTKLPSGGHADARHTENSPANREKCKKEATTCKRRRATKPSLLDRHVKHHSHPDKTLVPWERPGPTSKSPPQEKASKASATLKKVRFSPVVRVHVMRTWPFARQASRKGHWEEMVRDRDRFRRRIRETEQAIGHCLAPPHRERMRARLDGAFGASGSPEH